MMAESKAHALNTHSAAISTPAAKPGDAPMLVICGCGQNVNLSGVESLKALRDAIEHALGSAA